jgi:hypothetical protein
MDYENMSRKELMRFAQYRQGDRSVGDRERRNALRAAEKPRASTDFSLTT